MQIFKNILLLPDIECKIQSDVELMWLKRLYSCFGKDCDVVLM